MSVVNAVPRIDGVSTDWHGLSHHGKDPQKLSELAIVEGSEISVYNDFLTRLRAIEEDGTSLLDHTAILFGSNLGNASSHDWRNLPVIVAGGGFRHGQHIAFDQDHNAPLANLCVKIAQRTGVPIEQFGSSTAAGLPSPT